MDYIQFPTVSTDDLALDLTINAKGKITKAVPRPMIAGPVIWYNADEVGRVAHSNEYGSRGNLYIHPAVDQGLTRENLLELGRQMTGGHTFIKSACAECPFPSMEYLIDRAQKEWQEFARTVVREMQVFRLNPRMHLYGFGTAYWVAKEHSPQALARAQEMWAERGPWRIMRMRRVVVQCPNPSKANPIKWRVDSSRCLNTLELADTYEAAVDRLRQYGELTWIRETDLACVKYRRPPAWVKQLSPNEQRDRTLAGEDLRGEAYISYRVSKANWPRFVCNPFPVVEVKARNILVTPRCEEWITITPYSVSDKVANATKFESLWEETLGQSAQYCLF